MLLPTGLGVPLPTAPLRTVSKRYCDQRESLLTRIVLGKRRDLLALNGS